MKRTVLIFAALITALLVLFKLSTYAYASGDASIETIIAIIALVFFFVGVYLNKNSLPEIPTRNNGLDSNKVAASGISKREYEVLKEIALGLSNKEIGDKLFLSESTIKTHVSNLFVKLNAKRRTQAIQNAKDMQLI